MQSCIVEKTVAGPLLLESDALGLTGIWFEDRAPAWTETPPTEAGTAALEQAVRWLEQYDAGEIPKQLPPLHLVGTAFQQEVWQLLLEIPYGATTTYGALARKLAQKRGIGRMSAQAVGGAVGRNPISILIPCHRVIGADGSLVGFGGGLERKRKLLQWEQQNLHAARK